MTTAHVLDLIEHALDDCAMSDDAVRYNAEQGPASQPGAPYGPSPLEAAVLARTQTERIALQPCPYIVRARLVTTRRSRRRWRKRWAKVPVRLFVQLPSQRRRLRCMHTAHPARWRKP